VLKILRDNSRSANSKTGLRRDGKSKSLKYCQAASIFCNSLVILKSERETLIVVGIDPGLANLGIGVVSEQGVTPHYLHAELVKTSTESSSPQRLAMIYKAVKGVLEVHRPDALAIEAQFFQLQPGTAFKVGEAVGVVLLACAQLEIPVFEYSPKEVKAAVVGTGSASKDQIIYMVRAMLQLPKSPTSNHAADALALALTHLANRRIRTQMGISRRL
jgi:crossover junction endodeoxyribonuclease RuvC